MDAGSGPGESRRMRCGEMEWGMGTQREGQYGGWGTDILLCGARVRRVTMEMWELQKVMGGTHAYMSAHISL